MAAISICHLGPIHAAEAEFRALVDKMESDVRDLAIEVERVY